jgi:hypothetical protein
MKFSLYSFVNSKNNGIIELHAQISYSVTQTLSWKRKTDDLGCTFVDRTRISAIDQRFDNVLMSVLMS